MAHGPRRARAQPAATSTSTFPLGCFVAVTGVRGSGQEHARQRHPLPVADAEDLPVEDVARPAQDGSRASSTSTRSSTSTSRRSGARRARTRPPTPACSTRSARCSPATQEAKVRGYLPGPVLVQREGRPLRGVRGRRHDQDRDALPARRLRAVRGVQGRPLQPRHARHHVQGQEHRRGARHAVRGGARVLRQPAGHRPAHADAGRRRPRLRAPRPARADAVGRRGAAGEAGDRAGQALDRPHDLHPRRAHHRPPLRRRAPAAHACCSASSTRATRCS